MSKEINAFLNIIKPKDMSSAFAVGIVKKRLKTNCGHMGTLDPMASGVLPLGLNKASRLFRYLLDKDKVYQAEFTFGEETDTLDKTGKVIKTTTVSPTESLIKESLTSFIGEIDQIPPNYSAKCIDGKRGYELARSGKEFTLQPKKVIINGIDYLGQVDENTFRIKVNCKGGTYIRSLIRDIGYKCGSLANMTALDRLSAGVFTYENGVDVERVRDLVDDIEKYLIYPDKVLDYTKLILTEYQATRVINGLYDEYPLKDGLYRVYKEEYFWGVGEIKNCKLYMQAYVRQDLT